MRPDTKCRRGEQPEAARVRARPNQARTVVVIAGAVKNRRSMGLEIDAAWPLVNAPAHRVVALAAAVVQPKRLVKLQQLAVDFEQGHSGCAPAPGRRERPRHAARC